ncbi:MAG TPA: MinD/ParA family protein, partial [Marinagarivorans sp.]|nr:MinD/ParA family protein [Marinagarivorans sp.]
VPFDENVRKAVQKRKALLEFAPRCKASQAIRFIAQRIDQWPVQNSARGHLEFFFERLVASASGGM